MDEVIYDTHTLTVKCGPATISQIGQSFEQAIKNFETANDTGIECDYRVGLIENREGESYGLGFIFVTNPQVYHMLLGKNPDGSERIEYYGDPNWVEPPDADKKSLEWASISAPIVDFNSDWNDLELEYDRREKAFNEKFVQPKLSRKLPPLIKLPPFRLSSKQIEDKRSRILKYNETNGNKDDPIIFPEIEELEIDRANAISELNLIKNILKTKNIPPWVTARELKDLFKIYASDSTTKSYNKYTKCEDTYPFIYIAPDRSGYIIFDPSSCDALFAIHLMKKTFIKKEMSSSTLILYKCLSTDRDYKQFMFDISNPRSGNKSYTKKPNYENKKSNYENKKYNFESKPPREKHSRDNTPIVRNPPKSSANQNRYAILADNPS
jgi:hypothetical protein